MKNPATSWTMKNMNVKIVMKFRNFYLKLDPFNSIAS